jgi:hypothetical protein
MIFDCRCKHGIKKSFVAEVMYQLFFEVEFKDTKVVIRIRLSKKNRQHNGQKKKHKRTNNDIQNIYIKLMIEEHEPH